MKQAKENINLKKRSGLDRFNVCPCHHSLVVYHALIGDSTVEIRDFGTKYDNGELLELYKVLSFLVSQPWPHQCKLCQCHVYTYLQSEHRSISLYLLSHVPLHPYSFFSNLKLLKILKSSQVTIFITLPSENTVTPVNGGVPRKMKSHNHRAAASNAAIDDDDDKDQPINPLLALIPQADMDELFQHLCTHIDQCLKFFPT